MSTNIPPAAGSPKPPRAVRWFFYGCGSLLALLLLIVATVAITLWWIQRPIKPVVLSDKERTVVQAKLRYLEDADAGTSSAKSPRSPEDKNGQAPTPATKADQAAERPYIAGSKELKLTEREINGLLNANTDLGNSVRLEFATDAVNAYLAIPIPKDFPVAGGKMFRARGRFRLSLGDEGTPFAILEDVTVFGLSLPKAWLGGIKGENLLCDAVGQRKGSQILKGIKSLRIEPGALVLKVED